MKAAVVTLSDKGFRNEREDKSGELVQMMLKEAGSSRQEEPGFRKETVHRKQR